MRRKEIPKRSGGVRVVFCPSGKERKVLRRELRRLSSHTSVTLPHAHGFMAERSPLTAAKMHAGFAVTIGLDLKDFFPSVKPEMVKGLVPKDLNPLCWAGDGCGQGLPTAPAIANLAAKPMDEAIVKMLKKMEKAHTDLRTAYSRYADDLSVSFCVDPGQAEINKVKVKLAEVVRRCGFMPNPRKWRVQRAAGGRREVVGLLVGDTDDPIRPLRTWRRRYRALTHRLASLKEHELNTEQRNELYALTLRKQGWDQWMYPKPPLSPEEKKKRADQMGDKRTLEEANIICRKIKHAPMTEMRKDIQARSHTLPNGHIVRITNDPAYFIGISDFVTRGQRTASCLRTGLAWNSGFGQYGGTGAWWWQLRGCSIAHVIDPKNIVDCIGVKRPAQLARVLVFKLESGKLVYQRRTYGESDSSIVALRNFLEEQGFVKAGQPPSAGPYKMEKIVGEVRRDNKRLRPYLDGGSYHLTVKGGVSYDRVTI